MFKLVHHDLLVSQATSTLPKLTPCSEKALCGSLHCCRQQLKGPVQLLSQQHVTFNPDIQNVYKPQSTLPRSPNYNRNLHTLFHLAVALSKK